MTVVSFFLIIFLFISSFFLLMSAIWSWTPFRPYKWLFHDIFGWHEPDNDVTQLGCNSISHCKLCGKEICQDSQGNWFDI